MTTAPHPDLGMIVDLSRKLHDDVADVFKRMAELTPRAEYLPTIYLHGARKALALSVIGLGFFMAPGGELTLPRDRELLVALVFANLLARGLNDEAPDAVDDAFDAVEVLVAAGRAPRDDAFLADLRRHLSTVRR